MAVPLNIQDFSGMNLSHQVISDPSVRDNFSYAKFTGANLEHCEIRDAVLDATDFQSAILSFASLVNSRGHRATFSYANMNCVDMHNANFFSACLEHADLQHASMVSTKLIFAHMWDANLNGADLTSADLTNADLTNADLRGANLQNAKLTNAILVGARFDSNTIMPNGKMWDNKLELVSAPVLSDVVHKPMLNNENDVCYFCNSPTIPLMGRKRFCKKCKK